MSLADEFDNITSQGPRRPKKKPTPAPSDSVPVGLIGDERSPQARSELGHKLLELGVAMAHGPTATAKVQPLQPLNRARTASDDSTVYARAKAALSRLRKP